MGVITRLYHRSEGLTDNRYNVFFMDMGENIHIHYHDIRIELSSDEFLEFAELLCYDALEREESCGAHFRVEHQTAEGEALRSDQKYAYVSAWEFKGVGKKPELHKEPLVFEHAELAQRSYK